MIWLKKKNPDYFKTQEIKFLISTSPREIHDFTKKKEKKSFTKIYSKEIIYRTVNGTYNNSYGEQNNLQNFANGI